MSRDALAELRAHYTAFSRKDWNAVLPEVHPDFEFQPPRGGLDTEPVRGADSARSAFADFFGPYEEVSVEPEEFFERDDQIVVFFLQRLRLAGSTAYLERRAAHLWTMRDGKPARLEIVPQRKKALEAAGLDANAAGVAI